MVLKGLEFCQFLLGESVVPLKGLIFSNFHFGRMWLTWKDSFFTVSIFGGCGSLVRTDFESFHFGRVWCHEQIDFW